jgi:hypothetical protein
MNVVEFGTHGAPPNPSLKSREERVLQPPLLSIIKTNTTTRDRRSFLFQEIQNAISYDKIENVA